MLTAVMHPLQRGFDFARRAAATAPAGWLKREEAIMGTAISVELWCDERRAGEAACAAVMDEMHRIDRCMSPHKPASELSRINRLAARQAVPLSEEMTRLLARAIAFSRQSAGAFDITYAAVGRLYDYRRRVRPTPAALARARECVGWQMLELDTQAGTLRFEREGMCIDLGGFAKGHAVDNATALLQQRGVRHAYVAAGGDSRVIGDRRDRPWSVAIRDPRRAGEVIAVLPLVDTAVSTSGDYERYIDVPGNSEAPHSGTAERCHHLIDPATGRSPQHLRSVTVLAADGLTSEALSKTLFVMGAERGLAWLAAQHPDVDAVLVDAQGRLHTSAGFAAP